MPTQEQEWNAPVIAEFRANGGLAPNLEQEFPTAGSFPTNNEARTINQIASQLDVDVAVLLSFLEDHEVTLDGAVRGPGSYVVGPGINLHDLVMVAGFLNQLIYRLITRPDIKAIADLKGKRVAVSRFGAGADRATRFLLTKLGFNPEKTWCLYRSAARRRD